MEPAQDPLGQERWRVPAPPSPADIREQVERVLSSPELHSSARRRLLRFLVEETLAGRGDRLKGLAVAIEVFGRDASFRQQADPVVRLEARRLRRDLDSYYMGTGNCDPLRITIPKGGYVPHFAWQSDRPGAPPLESVDTGPGSSGAPTVRSRWMLPLILVFAALAVAVAIAATWLSLARSSLTETARDRGPAVIVFPFHSLGSAEDDRFFAAGMTRELVTDIMRFEGLRLYSMPASSRQDRESFPVDMGRDLGVAYVVRGSVRSEAAVVQVGAQLFDARTGQALWGETYDRARTPGALLVVQHELAAAIATELGQPYGVINSDLSARLSGEAAQGMPSYACVLRAYHYRRTFDARLHASVLSCLEGAVRREPGRAVPWALLGWLHLDAARHGLVPDAEAPRELDQALAMASKAIDVAPTSVVALQALAAVHFHMGRFVEAEREQRQALAINPNDPETLAQLGWQLAIRGRWDEGIPYLERAIARTVNPPGWYYDLITVHLYLQGKYPEMLASAEHAATGGPTGMSLLAIAQGALGNRRAARMALDRMAELMPELGRDPAAVYRRFQPIDNIVDALVDGLRKAGWAEPDGSAGVAP